MANPPEEPRKVAAAPRQNPAPAQKSGYQSNLRPAPPDQGAEGHRELTAHAAPTLAVSPAESGGFRRHLSPANRHDPAQVACSAFEEVLDGQGPRRQEANEGAHLEFSHDSQVQEDPMP